MIEPTRVSSTHFALSRKRTYTGQNRRLVRAHTRKKHERTSCTPSRSPLTERRGCGGAMGLTEDWSTVLLYAEAGVALYGNILFWLGGWTALDIDIWPRTWQRDSMYILVGALLLVVTDAWYANAGISGGHLPHLSLRFTSKFFWSAFEFVKCAAGMFGGMLLGSGFTTYTTTRCRHIRRS